MEAAIRWSPNATLSEQCFLLVDVTGHSFNLAKVASYDGKSLNYDPLPKYGKVPPFRAFDWAPFDESLVAVGQWSGEATLLRIDGSAAPVSLQTKHQRLCNAVSFSRTGLLATGLERVRNVECLNLWDVNQRLSSTPSPGGRAGKSVEPYRKYSSSGAISSIKFFIRQPEVLIAGVKGFGIRVYDLRENTGNASLQFQTSCVHNIATDPLNENHFACCGTGKDTTIQIWDCRSGSPHTTSGFGAGADASNQTSPVVEYSEAFTVAKDASQANIWSLRYCKGKSGFLGALASNGEFKVFETSHGYSRAENDGGAQLASNASNAFFAERLLTKRVHAVERAFDDTHQPRQESERIVSFDFTNLAGSKGTPSVIFLRGNGSVNLHELSGPPTAFSLSALGALSFSISYQAVPTSTDDQSNCGPSDGIRTHRPKTDGANTALSDIFQASLTIKAHSSDARSADNATAPRKCLLPSCEAHERAMSVQLGIKMIDIEDALAYVTLHRRRCAAGYALDAEKNTRIIGDDRWLQSMWSWIERAQNNAKDSGMIAGGLDLSYLGVFDIWNSDASSDHMYRRLTAFNTHADFGDAVIVLAESLEKTFPTWKTDSQEHRRVCLYTCGLGLSPQLVEATVKEMIDNSEKTKAAALAIIHSGGKLALQALRAGIISAVDRELSLALAGYLNGLTGDRNDTWHETIQNLAMDLQDPYARAILAFVSRGDWHDVLQETSLPLRDRVGIALMYLPDDELTQYINTSTNEAIKAGDIEGIILTGLGPKSVPLFENYIQKFSDLQTAVLALAFASPRYFTDPRVTTWRQTYRTQLDELGMFLQRAQFDVQHSKLSSLPDGASTLPSPPRQISIRCTYCDQSLDRNPDHNATAPNTSTNHGIHQGSIFGITGKAGTACPKCGRHMPRCVICMNWVGVPDPHTKGAVAKPMEKKEAMDNFVSVCRGCWHVTHAGHAEEWFRRHSVCPASGCDCRCVDVDIAVG